MNNDTTVIIIPHDIRKPCRVNYNNATGSEILKDELDILRVMREARSKRLQAAYEAIPKKYEGE